MKRPVPQILALVLCVAGCGPAISASRAPGIGQPHPQPSGSSSASERADVGSISTSASVPPASRWPTGVTLSAPSGQPDVANLALPGAPDVLVFQRVADDIAVLGWRPVQPSLTTRNTLVG